MYCVPIHSLCCDIDQHFIVYRYKTDLLTTETFLFELYLIVQRIWGVIIGDGISFKAGIVQDFCPVAIS